MSRAWCHTTSSIRLRFKILSAAAFHISNSGADIPNFQRIIRASKVLRASGRALLNETRFGKDQGLGGRLGRYKEFTGIRSRLSVFGSILGRVRRLGRVRFWPSWQALTLLTNPWDHSQDGYCLCPAGGRFPVGRVIDGKFERSVGVTSRKRNRTLAGLPSILGQVGRLSAPTGILLRTDYLQQKNKFNFDQFVVHSSCRRDLETDRFHRQIQEVEGWRQGCF